MVDHSHENMSDHRFEQRGLLHVEVQVGDATASNDSLVAPVNVHVIVVHLGLIPASRVRQVEQLHKYISREVPEGAALLVARQGHSSVPQMAHLTQGLREFGVSVLGSVLNDA